MEQDYLRLIVGILLVGVGMQWLAWRYHLPAIVLLSLSGIVVGPVLGLVNPVVDFGSAFRPMIMIAVCIILFEGGLHLNYHELHQAGKIVQRLVTIGAFLAWVLTSGAAHFIGGMDWIVSLVFGAILVVTGPTVIMPLLRQARLNNKVSNILKWEGILNDPIGALLAVLVFEVMVAAGQGITVMVFFLGAVLTDVFLGYVMGNLLAEAFHRGIIPEFLKGPLLFTTVLTTYWLANQFQEEGGLVTVTVLGMTMANLGMENIDEIRRFKEQLTILFVSAIFVMLTATLRVEHIQAMGVRDFLFVITLLFVIRPLSVWISTLGTGLNWRELLLIGWIAPRGVVAVAVSGLFAQHMMHHGHAEAARLIPLSFAIVFATVLSHGFSIGWLGRLLGLSSQEKNKILVVGASSWSVQLCIALKNGEIPVLLADKVQNHLWSAREEEVPIYYGELLSEDAESHIDIKSFSSMLVLTDDNSYNALLSMQYQHEFGRSGIYQIWDRDFHHSEGMQIRNTTHGKRFLSEELGFEQIEELFYSGWRFAVIDSYDYVDRLEVKDFSKGVILMALVDEREQFIWNSPGMGFDPAQARKLVVFASQERLDFFGLNGSEKNNLIELKEPAV
jgi:NhaP-type Na+/H+ or K+/H+ antiporter